MKKPIYLYIGLLILISMSMGFLASTALAGSIPVGPNIRIADEGLAGDDAEEVDLAVVGDTIYAVWRDERDDGYDTFGSIYFAKSTDGGVTWSQNVRVTDPTYDDWAHDPALAVQPNGTIWIVWYQLYQQGSNKVNDIRLAYSTDGGQSFDNDSIIVNGLDSNETLWRPDIAADANQVYVLYRYYNCQDPCRANDPEGYTISLKTIDSAVFDVSTTIVSDDLYAGRFISSTLDNGPAIDLTLVDGILCAAWEDQRDRFALYGACSQDNGQTFRPNFAFTGSNSVNPHIALAPDGKLYATYALSNDANNNIWLRYSNDLGLSWSNPTSITNIDSFEITDWDLTVDENGQLVLPWVYDNSFISTDLFLSTSLDEGQNWSVVQVEDEQGQYPTTSNQRHPNVVVSGSGDNVRAYVAWNDDRNLNDQIWFARFLLDGILPTVPQNLQATPADTAIALTWQVATDATGIQGYRVYRASTDVGPFSEITPVLVSDITYVDVELPTGIVFFYQVAAVDGTGNTGGRSNIVSAVSQVGTATSTFGTLAYESGDAIRLHNLANGQESIIADASQPRFSSDGTTLYQVSDQGVWQRPAAGGSPQLFQLLGNPNDSIYLTEYDIAANSQNFGAIVARSFASVGSIIWCTVTEPHAHNNLGQRIFTDEFIYGSELALSPDHRWLTYRYRGFCNAVAAGTTSPGDFCIADLNNLDEVCLDGADYRDSDFAPNSNWVVFAAPLTGQYEIWKAKLEDDGTLAYYTQLTRGPENSPSREPSWATDGNWIVFQRDMDLGAGEDWQLHLTRADGVSLRALNIVGQNPAWLGGGSTPAPPGFSNQAYLPLVIAR